MLGQAGVTTVFQPLCWWIVDLLACMALAQPKHPAVKRSGASTAHMGDIFARLMVDH
jgi:hypothetical protein